MPTLQDRGVPMPVEKVLVAPPRSRMGAITDAERMQIRAGSPVGAKYDTTVDRESAAELLARKAEAASRSADAPPAKSPGARDATGAGEGGLGRRVNEWLWGTKRRQGVAETMAKQAARTVGSQIGRRILRGVLGGIIGGR